MTPEQLADGYAWCYRRLFSHGSIWRRRPANLRRVPPYLAMAYLYKRANPLWRLLDSAPSHGGGVAADAGLVAAGAFAVSPAASPSGRRFPLLQEKSASRRFSKNSGQTSCPLPLTTTNSTSPPRAR